MQFKSLAGVLLAGAVAFAVPAAAMMSTDPAPAAKSRNYTEGERLVKAKEYAKAWLDYARISNQDDQSALQLCLASAGALEYCLEERNSWK